MVRADQSDLIYQDRGSHSIAVVDDVVRAVQKGTVLIGTDQRRASSTMCSKQFTKRRSPHTC